MVDFVNKNCFEKNCLILVSLISIPLILLFLLFYSSIINTQQTGHSVIFTAETFRTSTFFIYSLIAVGAAYGVVSFAYMLSKLFSSTQIQAWAKNEFYQITATLIIVLFVFGILVFETEIFKAFGYQTLGTGSGTENPAIENAQNYLKHVRVYTSRIVASSMGFNLFMSSGLTVLSKIDLLIISIKDAVNLGIRDKIKDMIGIVISSVGVAIGITTGQIWLLNFITKTAFAFFLPLGIFFRAMPFLRGLGSTMVTLAIVFYLVYPISFILNEKITNHLFGKNWWTNKQLYTTTATGSESEVKEDSIAGEAKKDILGFFKSLLFESGGVILLVLTGTYMFRDAALAFIVFGLFLPFLNLTITFGMAKELGKILGTDVDLSSLMKIL